MPYDLEFESRSREKRRQELANVIDSAEIVAASLRKRGISIEVNTKIAALGNLSLLHAAVLLEDETLVRRLLAKNADPAAHSNLGSPIEIVQRLISSTELFDRKQSMKKIYNLLFAKLSES